MLSINTNLSSMIVQNSMGQATSKLNQAIERMSTGFKINHASDNAANYSISTNMTTKMSAYMVAEDNTAMGLDLVTTMSDTLSLMSSHAQRIRDLCEQASNGTYGNQSLQAIQSEIDARLAEIDRIQASAEYNGISLLDSITPTKTGKFLQDIEQLSEEEAIAQGYTIIKTADELQAMKDDLSAKYILMNDIDLKNFDWESVMLGKEFNGNGFTIKNLNSALFSNTDFGTVLKNICIDNAQIQDENSIGILANMLSQCTISNCSVTGTIRSDKQYVGGVFGTIDMAMSAEASSVQYCYADVNVISESVDSSGGVGVIAGFSYCTIKNCYATGSINSNTVITGGIGGRVFGADSCYSDVDIISSSNKKGAILGEFYVNSGAINNSFWNNDKCSLDVTTNYLSLVQNSSGLSSSEFNEKLNANMNLLSTISMSESALNKLRASMNLNLQVGISADENSRLNFSKAIEINTLLVDVSNSIEARNCLTSIDEYLSRISAKQTELGAVQNRLESALDEIAIQYDNLASSRSTLRDADMAELSSQYIKMQILQQASATLLATANQSPSIALQLI